MQWETLTIVGVGLIGGSIGQAARQRGVVRQVIGVGRDPKSLEQAAVTGAIDRFTLDLADGVRQADLVIFCTPVDSIAEKAIAASFSCKKGAILSDAGSTKAKMVNAIEGNLAPGVAFVGSHPLAGSEKRGPGHARPDLLEGRVVIVTPIETTPPSAVEQVSAFWQSLGGEVHYLSPEAHDRALATTSHLPHLLASTLAGLLPDEWHCLTATGFRDTTRVAAGDPALWAAIFRANAKPLGEAIAAFGDHLAAFWDAVLQENDQKLIELLQQAKQVRDALGS